MGGGGSVCFAKNLHRNRQEDKKPQLRDHCYGFIGLLKIFVFLNYGGKKLQIVWGGGQSDH